MYTYDLDPTAFLGDLLMNDSLNICVEEVLVSRTKETMRVVIVVVDTMALVELGVQEASDIEGVVQEGALHLPYVIIDLLYAFDEGRLEMFVGEGDV